MTRTNESMYFVKIEDLTGALEILVFPSLLKETINIWQEGRVVLCQGKLSDKDQDIKLLVNTAVEVNMENKKEAINLFKNKKDNIPVYNGFKRFPKKETPIEVNAIKDTIFKLSFNDNMQHVNFEDLKIILNKHSGNNKVVFEIEQGDKVKVVETSFFVNGEPSLKAELNEKFGQYLSIKL